MVRIRNHGYGVWFELQYARVSNTLDTVYDPERDLPLLKEAGISTVSMQLYETYQGTLLYDSKRYPQFRENPDRDYLKETLEAARKLDMNVWVWSAEKGLPTVGPIYQEFKDCLELDQHGNTLATWDHNFLCLCINSRWRQFLIEMYQEVLTNYDGIECIIVSDEVGYSDAVRWGGYCPRCKQLFKDKHGAEPPTVEDWGDRSSLWWSFIRERQMWWKEYVAELAHEAKKAAPEVSRAIIINAFAMSTVLKGVDPWEITQIPDLDIIGSDLFFRVFEQDHPTYHAWVGALFRAFAAQSDKRVFLTSSAYRTASPPDIVLGTLDAAVYADAGVFYYNLRHLCDRKPNLDAVRSVSSISEILAEHAPGAIPVKGAAIILPKYLWETHYYENSSQLMSESVGTYQLLTLAGIPAHILFEDQLSELHEHCIVFVPELFAPPEDVVIALSDYVASGGTLVMSLQTANGPRDDRESALWDIFSVGYNGPTPPIRQLRLGNLAVSDENGEALAVHLPVLDWPIVQHQLFGGFPNVSHQRAWLSPSPQSRTLLTGLDDDGKEYPVLVETSSGKGTTILSAESIGTAFNSYMIKCAGHPSIWMSRAMKLRDFWRSLLVGGCGSALRVMAEAEGNVATYWWTVGGGYAALVINHEYSETRSCRLRFMAVPQNCSVEVHGAKDICQPPGDQALVMEISIEPASAAVVVVKPT